MKLIKVKVVVKYGGHSVSANGAVNLTLKADYSELTNSVQILQMLNEDVTIKAKLAGKKAMKLGMFRVKNVNIEDDGDSVLKFNGLSDYIEMDNLNVLPLNTDENPLFQVMLECEAEEADDGSEEEEKDGEA